MIPVRGHRLCTKNDKSVAFITFRALVCVARALIPTAPHSAWWDRVVRPGQERVDRLSLRYSQAVTLIISDGSL